MTDGNKSPTAPPGRYRGPQGLGEAAAIALEKCAGSGQCLSGVEEAAFLQTWFADQGRLISESVWSEYILISNQTAEHEVRYRRMDHRAVKRTWPGTFGLIPRLEGAQWSPKPAGPGDYLARLSLQNELFGDDLLLEGGMVNEGPSMLIGQVQGGLSMVISQPWLQAGNISTPHPSESDLNLYLEARGFRPLNYSFYGWINEEGGLVILDAKPDNFITTSAGILPIDLLIAEFQSNN